MTFGEVIEGVISDVERALRVLGECDAISSLSIPAGPASWRPVELETIPGLSGDWKISWIVPTAAVKIECDHFKYRNETYVFEAVMTMIPLDEILHGTVVRDAAGNPTAPNDGLADVIASEAMSVVMNWRTQNLERIESLYDETQIYSLDYQLLSVSETGRRLVETIQDLRKGIAGRALDYPDRPLWRLLIQENPTVDAGELILAMQKLKQQ